jgi:small-conductance mechanosensitive channel
MTKPFSNFLREPMFDIGGTPVSITTLSTAALIVVGSFILSKLIQKGIRRSLARRGVEHLGAASVVGRLLHYMLMATGVAMAMQTAGVQLGALFAAGAFFAVGVGFAMQNITQNFVSGVILLVERTIKPGDVLEVGGEFVRVDEMGIRTTLVRTLDEEDLIVPNATLVQSTVKNFTLRDPHYRLRVKVGVAYGSDMEKVREVLEKAGRDVPWREPSKEPLVLLTDFGSSSVDWELAVWTNEPWSHRVRRSEMREAIWHAFSKAGITIAFPQLDLHVDPALQSSLDRMCRAA